MLSKYILLFTLCSVVGWVYESIYALIKTGKWEARGFLYGPLCPIYGFGVCGIVLLAKAYLLATDATYAWWQIVLVAFFGSMLLEYITSWLLEQLFHAYWWDYSDMPLNINGRTCIPAGVLFALGGLAAVEIISPWWDGVAAGIPVLAMDILGFIVVVLITMDATLTIAALTEVQERVEFASRAFHEHADLFTASIKDKGESVAEGVTSRLVGEKESLHEVEEEVSQSAFDTLNAAARMALSRVEGFRLPKPTLPAGPSLDVPAFAKNLLDRAKNWRM